METQELLDTLDIQWTLIGTHLGAFRQTREGAYLGEMKLSAEALYTVAEELERRQENQISEVAPARQIRPTRHKVPRTKAPKAPREKGYTF